MIDQINEIVKSATELSRILPDYWDGMELNKHVIISRNSSCGGVAYVSLTYRAIFEVSVYKDHTSFEIFNAITLSDEVMEKAVQDFEIMVNYYKHFAE